MSDSHVLKLKEAVDNCLADFRYLVLSGQLEKDGRFTVKAQSVAITHASKMSDIVVLNCDKWTIRDLLCLKLVPVYVWDRMNERSKIIYSVVRDGGNVSFDKG